MKFVLAAPCLRNASWGLNTGWLHGLVSPSRRSHFYLSSGTYRETRRYVEKDGTPEVKWTKMSRTESTPQLKNWGVVLFRAFDGQDIFGPLDALQLLAFQRQMNLYLIAETFDPVTSEPASAAMNSKNSSFWPIILPTHTFANAPELDVLFVPGGAGVRAPDVKNITDFIADRYPSLEYLITVCTGAGLAAKSGVLDGRRATTNKSAWSTVTAWGDNVDWIRQARWVVDGNIWTSAGVSPSQGKLLC